MLTMDREKSLLLIIDFQARLMPAIEDGEVVMLNAQRLVEAARLFGVPRLFTEQNPKGLGVTVERLAVGTDEVVHKQHFDVCREPGFLDRIPADGDIIVTGCEAHVCVLQTVLGLLDAKRKIYVVGDAIGSRRVENRDAAIRRTAHHGAEIVTTEMVLFEWLGSAGHPRFRQAVALIK